MKKLLFIISIIPVLALGQSTDQNYVKTTTYKEPTTASSPNPDVNVANVQVSYFDGLGRPIQQVAHKQSNTGKDIITHIEYDPFGRQTSHERYQSIRYGGLKVNVDKGFALLAVAFVPLQHQALAP